MILLKISVHSDEHNCVFLNIRACYVLIRLQRKSRPMTPTIVRGFRDCSDSRSSIFTSSHCVTHTYKVKKVSVMFSV